MSVETSTPKARAFVDALLDSASLKGVDYSLTSRELRAIVSGEDIGAERDHHEHEKCYLAARALLYLGQGQERQGADKARATYKRIVRDFGNQTEMVAVAQQRLLALGRPRSSGTLAKRLLCAGCGDAEADFSSDGRWMAITDWNSGDLAVRDISTGQVKRLMVRTGTGRDSDSYVETPILSPDLRQIVYLWDTGERSAHVQLRVAPNETAAKARVLMDNKENVWYTPTAWSPDGKSIVVIVAKTTTIPINSRVWQYRTAQSQSVGWRFKGGA